MFNLIIGGLKMKTLLLVVTWEDGSEGVLTETTAEDVEKLQRVAAELQLIWGNRNKVEIREKI